jgi:hypothetical protein
MRQEMVRSLGALCTDASSPKGDLFFACSPPALPGVPGREGAFSTNPQSHHLPCDDSIPSGLKASGIQGLGGSLLLIPLADSISPFFDGGKDGETDLGNPD